MRTCVQNKQTSMAPHTPGTKTKKQKRLANARIASNRDLNVKIEKSDRIGEEGRGVDRWIGG